MKISPSPACVGRPRAFDPEIALEKAMRVFWEKGYEGTSLSDLTEAMGINRPSLYAAFGNKEALFHRVLDYYGAGPASYVLEALEQPTARAVIEKLLHGTVAVLSDPKNPRGCLAVQSALCSGDAAAMAQTRERRILGQKKICERLERAQAEGELPADLRPADLARYIAILMHGLSVQATNGASRAEMLRAVDIALRAVAV